MADRFKQERSAADLSRRSDKTPLRNTYMGICIIAMKA